MFRRFETTKARVVIDTDTDQKCTTIVYGEDGNMICNVSTNAGKPVNITITGKWDAVV